jgi:hypothetical protein
MFHQFNELRTNYFSQKPKINTFPVINLFPKISHSTNPLTQLTIDNSLQSKDSLNKIDKPVNDFDSLNLCPLSPSQSVDYFRSPSSCFSSPSLSSPFSSFDTHLNLNPQLHTLFKGEKKSLITSIFFLYYIYYVELLQQVRSRNTGR